MAIAKNHLVRHLLNPFNRIQPRRRPSREHILGIFLGSPIKLLDCSVNADDRDVNGTNRVDVRP